MSTTQDLDIKKTDTLVQTYAGASDESPDLTRVVLVCLDPVSADTTFQWALDNFIVPKKDLVVLVHVRQIDIPVAPYINSTGYIDDVSQERREESHHLLRVFAEELNRRKVACKAISMVGDPKAEILRKTKEIKADVVLMGARKMGTIKRTLLGSVSDYIVHNCPCTVIVTKVEPPSHHEERRKSIVSLTSSMENTK
ncbi:universal stress protein YxiE-like [Mucor ambiguus]|uniref:Universal stress protein YxiE-like n=1 Tax=Mucor ambiguus TaxID=91626 RepID=A0A0C9LT50_9FUNG|nr:universal stress protein YxiE-like [Mucor ambiguus]